uniref:Uncharacterized protein n=1 Tax=Tanacetum cinerariifolium TaxID=118510 RepID=A0A6L2KFR8_TANCI|nr:hypothetical protein [Tanacetum cinerariifolium]
MFKWVFDDELEAPKKALQSPGHAPPSPNYVPDYVSELEYLEYLVPSDDEVPIEDQPLPADASPAALSPDYVADSDPKHDPEEHHADYSVDRGDDDDDDDDDKENEEYLAPVDSSTIPAVDPVLSVDDIEALVTDESAPTPPSPRLCRARISVKLQTPMSANRGTHCCGYCCTTFIITTISTYSTIISTPLDSFTTITCTISIITSTITIYPYCWVLEDSAT